MTISETLTERARKAINDPPFGKNLASTSYVLGLLEAAEITRKAELLAALVADPKAEP